MKSKLADGKPLGSLILIISENPQLLQNNTTSENNIPGGSKQKFEEMRSSSHGHCKLVNAADYYKTKKSSIGTISNEKFYFFPSIRPSSQPILVIYHFGSSSDLILQTVQS